jgi:hypothetical protein
MSKSKLDTCHPIWWPRLLYIALLKMAIQPKNRKSPNVSGTTRRPLSNIVYLKIGTAKNRISLHVNENIEFDFPWGIRICNQNHHLRLGTPPAKNSKSFACHLKKAQWNRELARTLNMWSILPCGPPIFVSSKIGNILKTYIPLYPWRLVETSVFVTKNTTKPILYMYSYGNQPWHIPSYLWETPINANQISQVGS